MSKPAAIGRLDKTTPTIRISFDPSSLAWITEITRCLSVLNELVPRPVEIIDLIDNLPDRAAAFNLRSLPTLGTDDRRLVLEPCQGFRDLVAAVRAREGVGEFVACLGHDLAPSETIDCSANAGLGEGH